MKLTLSMALLTLAFALSACAEKSQVAATKKADGRPWEAS